MSYLVLALGGLLSLCGALAVYAGYGIIQVERGWASVIAGSTALSCGIVTLALGFILNRLSALDALLTTGRQGANLARESGQASGAPAERGQAFNPEDAMVPEAGLAPPAMSPAAGSRTQRAARPSFLPGRNILKPRGTFVPGAVRLREPDRSSDPGDSGADERYAEPASQLDFAAAAEEEAPPGPRAGLAGDKPAEVAREGEREPWLFEDGEEKAAPIEPPLPEGSFAPSEPETRAAPRPNWPAETASIDAITAEAFYPIPEPVLEASVTAADEPLPEALEPASLKPALPEKSESEAVARLPDLAEADAPVIKDETLAIVGRYQSDGTSYVMYADGSIEARTERAVFHFNTMAELKSFMESQAQKPRD
jgi:hypothetical protein